MPDGTPVAGLRALREAAELGAGRLDPDLVARAAAVCATADERLTAGAGVVVVALAGGTGGGKSSLFNALTGAPLARVAATRPTTDEPTAWSVGAPEEAAAVLDWLGVRRRHHAQPAATALPEGLVLLDLPDHDSIATDHRLLVERLVARVDVCVWVTDPLKYSQADLHDVWLAKLSEHAEVTVVVLNRVDELSQDDRAGVLAHLRMLLARRGLGRAPLLATSARTGEGVAALADTIARIVARRRAVAERIAADVRTAAAELGAVVGEPRGPRLEGEPLVTALATATGVDALAAAGARSYTEDANDRARPPLQARVGRWLRALRPGPARLRRPPARRDELSPVAVRHAVGELVAAAAGDLPHPWPAQLQEAGARLSASVPGDVGAALDRVDVHAVRPRRWWTALGALATVVELATVAGVGWLLLLAVAAWLRLPEPPTPAVGELEAPTALAAGGALLSLLLAVVRRRLVALGAERHRLRVRRQLLQAVRQVVDERVVAPLRDELARHDRLADAVRRARGG